MALRSSPAPVIVFVYNRPDHFSQSVEFLKAAKGAGDTDLIIYSDGARIAAQQQAVDEVRQYAENITGFKSVRMRKSVENKGLRASVIQGVSESLEEYARVIILEDDICVGPEFLNFMHGCLEKYAEQKNIWSVSGYCIPALGKQIHQSTGADVFLGPRASSWGWATWKDRWEQVEWDKKKLASTFLQGGNFLKYYSSGGDKNRMLLNELGGRSNSWAILWDFNHFLHHAYCIYPAVSHVKNIGLDSSGVHSTPHPAYDVRELATTVPALPQTLISDPRIHSAFAKVNRKWYRDLWDILRYVKLKIFN